jgi:hypothetical protein
MKLYPSLSGGNVLMGAVGIKHSNGRTRKSKESRDVGSDAPQITNRYLEFGCRGWESGTLSVAQTFAALIAVGPDIGGMLTEAGGASGWASAVCQAMRKLPPAE